jgi:hypothetical protein
LALFEFFFVGVVVVTDELEDAWLARAIADGPPLKVIAVPGFRVLMLIGTMVSLV